MEARGVVMSEVWFYVQGDKSVGPVTEEKIRALFNDGSLGPDNYVWRKEFANWKKASQVQEFNLQSAGERPTHKGDNIWNLDEETQTITIKVGYDRGSDESEFGPYNLEQMRRAFREKRINGKTFVFVPGAENWKFLADTPLFKKISADMPPVINEGERRIAPRKPFVARILFHDQSQVFEGVCRDISEGGLQILVAGFQANVGDVIKMNIHPDNGDLCFSASGKIVRILNNNQGLALRFENLDGPSRSLIQSYINNS